jgi:hypothetical protein
MSESPQPPTEPRSEPIVHREAERPFHRGIRDKQLIARPMPFPGFVEGMDVSVDINWTERNMGPDGYPARGWHGEGQSVAMSWEALRKWASDVVDMCDKEIEAMGGPRPAWFDQVMEDGDA